MSEQVLLTKQSIKDLEKLSQLIPGISNEFIIETSLSITAALYEKSSAGAVLRVEYADGKAEELRFKLKKASAKKVKTP